MRTRQLGNTDLHLTTVGFGAWAIGGGDWAYGWGPQDDAESVRAIHRALDLGVNWIDTAAVYGLGHSEEVVARALADRRGKVIVATKCGLRWRGPKMIYGRLTAASIREEAEASLRRLRMEAIDLYQIHWPNPDNEIEEGWRAMADLVREGKVRAIGLSEVSAATLKRAHAVHPIAALQTEYSLWTRNAEIAVLDACREIGAAFVAFSPVARGFLTRTPPDVAALDANDIRRGMPRFHPEPYAANLRLLPAYQAIAEEVGCTPAQLALAWLLTRGEHVITIPGTSSIEHLRDNFGAATVTLAPEVVARLDALINRHTVAGDRYGAQSASEVDTETF